MDNSKTQKTKGVIKNRQFKDTENTKGVIKNRQFKDTGQHWAQDAK